MLRLLAVFYIFLHKVDTDELAVLLKNYPHVLNVFKMGKEKYFTYYIFKGY